MADRRYPSATSPCEEVKNSVCIHTDKVYDSCKDKDCIEDARVYFAECDTELIEKAVSIKAKKAEVIWAYPDVEAIPFNCGYYTVDTTFYFKITFEVCTDHKKPICVEGLAVFSKKVVLFGSEGSAKIFTSQYTPEASCGCESCWQKTNLPRAIVEVVDPLVLAVNTKEYCETDCNCPCTCNFDLSTVPEGVLNVFDDALTDNGRKEVYVSIGLFSIVRLERSVQLLVPAYDFCVPQKECDTSFDNNPCDLFEKIGFPFDEFFPPEKEYCDEKRKANCCCD